MKKITAILFGTFISIPAFAVDVSAVANIASSLTKKDSGDSSEKTKIGELTENANAMKAKENSTANKTLTAASGLATGLGASQYMSAKAEQKSDEAAENDMKAYLATFRCNYNGGVSVAGGKKNIELPAGNALIGLYSDYKTKAAALKSKKESLGMTPGIESETILDKANTGLYDDVGIGKTGSAGGGDLSEALTNANSDDAAQIAAQKAKTASTAQTGAILAGAGIIGGIAGNMLINKNSAKENSDEIIARYEKTLTEFKKTVEEQPEPVVSCPSGSTADASQNCVCSGNSVFYNNSCNACTNGKIPNDEKNDCVCPADKPQDQSGNCVAKIVPPECDTTDTNIAVNTTDGTCGCTTDALINGFIYDSQIKKCIIKKSDLSGLGNLNLTDNLEVGTLKTIPLPTNTPKTKKTVISDKSMFTTGSANLSTATKTAIVKMATDLKPDDNSTDYCIKINGYTDRTGPATYNKKLSEDRANAIRQEFIANKLNPDNITAKGFGEETCDTKDGVRKDDCKRVEFEITPGTSCTASSS